MSLLLAIFVGVIVGLIGSFIIQDNFDLALLTILLGIGGAILGDAIYFFTVSNEISLFAIGGILAQAIGAALFVLIFSLLHRAAPEPSEDEH